MAMTPPKRSGFPSPPLSWTEQSPPLVQKSPVKAEHPSALAATQRDTPPMGSADTDSEVNTQLSDWVNTMTRDAGKSGVSFTAAKSEMGELDPALNARDKKFAVSLREELGSGDIDSRGAASQRMMRGLSQQEKIAYKEKSNADKLKFRQEWAAATLQKYSKKTYTQAWKKIDINLGTYESASRIFQLEGGTENDLEATKNILLKCVKMGYPFTCWNSFSGRFDFLYFKKQVREELSRCWELYESSCGDEVRTELQTP